MNRFFTNFSTAAALLFAVVSAGAQQAVDPKIEFLELQTTLQVANAKLQDLEKQLATAKQQNAALAQGTAAANAEAGQLKENYEKLRGLLEGLGVGALENSTDQVQERLLAALSDLRIVDEQKKKVTESLVTLAESAMLFAKSGDAQSKASLEASLANAEKTLRSMGLAGDENLPAKNLHDARIVSLKPELGVAVLDVGSRDGVKPGMPFEIYREDKPIARALVTDVRRGISGAVVQELMNNADPVKVGDRGQIDPNRAF